MPATYFPIFDQGEWVDELHPVADIAESIDDSFVKRTVIGI
jgi:hypothetical protein